MDLSGSRQGAGGVGGLLAFKKGPATYYPTYDGNGNVSEYLNSAGAIVAHYEYDPFGNTIVITGPQATTFTHRFSTKPLDTTTGLYYYGYRYYDPVTGRWPSRDPIEEEGGINLYGFTYNAPIYYVDSDGRLVFLAPFAWKFVQGVALDVGVQMIKNGLEGKSIVDIDVTSAIVAGAINVVPIPGLSGAINNAIGKVGNALNRQNKIIKLTDQIGRRKNPMRKMNLKKRLKKQLDQQKKDWPSIPKGIGIGILVETAKNDVKELINDAVDEIVKEAEDIKCEEVETEDVKFRVEFRKKEMNGDVFMETTIIGP